MSRVVWLFAVLAPVAVVILGLRWSLTDLLLDRFGWHSDSWTRGARLRTPRRSTRGDAQPETPAPTAYGETPEDEFFP